MWVTEREPHSHPIENPVQGGVTESVTMGMRRNWLVATIVMALVVGSALGRSAQEIARLGLASTVTLVAYDADGVRLGSGSGFFVADDLVVTNFHVIEMSAWVWAYRVGESKLIWVDSVVSQDKELDLAVLQLRAPLGVPLPLRQSGRPEIGAEVYVVGSPLGLEGTFTHGLVSSYRDIEGVPAMQFSAPISPGSSGGPVLDAAGEVVGVVFGGFVEGQNLNFAVPLPQLLSFLEPLRTTEGYSAGALSRGPVAGPAAAAAGSPETGPPTPGFDCDYAATWSELAICESHRLAHLDVRLNEVFAEVRARLPQEAFERLHQEQVAWLGVRESCEYEAPQSQEPCLAEVIRERIAVLQAYE